MWLACALLGYCPGTQRVVSLYNKRVMGDSMAKVLVIDDEPEARVLLDIHLRHRGYDVLLAGDGWKGLQLYHQEHPDVILLDLNMPELDGITVLKQIRAVDLKQPVIVMTADSNPETERQVRAIGVNEFVLKSCSMHLLEDTLAHLFMGRKPKFG
jgi:CheY-like chemotaxis protein